LCGDADKDRGRLKNERTRLWLKNLLLSNFRNFRRLSLEFCPQLNVLQGENGQGKTNLLEAIYCLGHGISFRTSSDRELIKWGEVTLHLKGEGIELDRSSIYEFSLGQEVPKVRRVNSQAVNLRDANKWLWMVVFSPDDLELIKGPPSLRRSFLDGKLSLFNLHYPSLQASYNRVLSQRNFLLSTRKKDIDEYLQSWDNQLVNLGTRMVKIRLEGLRKLEFFFKEVYSKVIGRKARVNLTYKCSFLKRPSHQLELNYLKESFFYELKYIRRKEIEKGLTLIGPHRDDFLVLVDGVDLRSFGSQGEQRISALSLKLAEIDLVKSKRGDYPIILLDDVASELDSRRQRLLMDLIQGSGQVFITTTQPSLYGPIFTRNTFFFEVKEGRVRRKR